MKLQLKPNVLPSVIYQSGRNWHSLKLNQALSNELKLGFFSAYAHYSMQHNAEAQQIIDTLGKIGAEPSIKRRKVRKKLEKSTRTKKKRKKTTTRRVLQRPTVTVDEDDADFELLGIEKPKK